MTLSLSSVVCSFVSSSVMKEFLKLKQDLLDVLSSPEEFQLCFKNVYRVFEVSRVFQGCSKEVLRGLTGKFQGCFKEVARVF